MRTPVKTHLPNEDAPIEWAVTADGVLYTAHVPLRADGSIETGPIELQAELTFDNLKRTLEAAGGTLDDVTQVLIYLTDPGGVPGHERGLSPLLRQALPEPGHGHRGRPDGARRGDRDRGLRPPQARLTCAHARRRDRRRPDRRHHRLVPGRARPRGHRGRPQSRPGRRGELRQWLPGHAQHVRQLGRPGHAAQDPEMARPRGRAHAAAAAALPGMAGWGLRFLRECSEPRWRANTRATYALATASLARAAAARRRARPGIRPQPARPDQAVPRPAVDGERDQGQPPLCRARPPSAPARSGPVRRARSRRWRRSASGSPAASSTRPTRAATRTGSCAPWPSAARLAA